MLLCKVKFFFKHLAKDILPESFSSLNISGILQSIVSGLTIILAYPLDDQGQAMELNKSHKESWLCELLELFKHTTYLFDFSASIYLIMAHTQT